MCETGVEAGPCFFFFWFVFFKADLKLRIKKTQTYPLTMICEVVFFFCGKPDLFCNSIKGLWHLISSQLHLTVCRVFVSLKFISPVFIFIFSLNDCTPGKLNSTPVCVSVDAGRTLWTCLRRQEATVSFQVCSSWVLPHCCHCHVGLQHIRHMHVIITSPPLFVLNHSPLLPFLPCDLLCWIGLEKDVRFLGKMALLSALCMFFKASKDPFSYQYPTDGLLFLFLPHHCFCWRFISLCSVRKALKQIGQLRGSWLNSHAFKFGGVMLKHCAVVAIARHFCTEGLVCPVIMKMLLSVWVGFGRLKPKPVLKWPPGLLKHVDALPTPGYTRTPPPTL